MIKTTSRIGCGTALSGLAASPLGQESGLGCACGKSGPCTCGKKPHGPKFQGRVTLDATVRPAGVDVDFRVKGTFSKKAPAPAAQALAGLRGR